MSDLRLSRLHKHILRAIASEGFLKAHRDIEGNKTYKLHLLGGGEEIIPSAAVAYLLDHGLIDSNKKFPAATYWLTPRGTEVAKGL
jgi:hypothetical protein